RHGLTRAAMCVNPAGGRTPRGFCYARIPPGARPPMSDLQAEPRPPQPFPAEEASSAAPADPLAGDWSEGLPGPVRAHGLPLPARVGTGPRALPAAEPTDAAEMEVSIEAPDAWTVGDRVAGGTGQALQPAETPCSEPERAPGLMPVSSAMPDESTWSAPPPGEGAELMPEPAAPAWASEQRQVFTPLAAGASLSDESEEGPRTVEDDEAQLLLRPVED